MEEAAAKACPHLLTILSPSCSCWTSTSMVWAMFSSPLSRACASTLMAVLTQSRPSNVWAGQGTGEGRDGRPALGRPKPRPWCGGTAPLPLSPLTDGRPVGQFCMQLALRQPIRSRWSTHWCWWKCPPLCPRCWEALLLKWGFTATDTWISTQQAARDQGLSQNMLPTCRGPCSASTLVSITFKTELLTHSQSVNSFSQLD